MKISRKSVTHALTLSALAAAAVVGLETLCVQEMVIRMQGGGRIKAVATTQAETSELPDPPKPATQPGNREPGGLMDRAADSGAQVYVDDSFAMVEKLRTALRYVSQGRSQDAINAFQDIIDNYGQKLVYLNNDSYVSSTDYIREKMLTMPDVQKGMYDQLFGTPAQRDVDAAIELRDLSGLIRVCDRYFCSTAAQKGLLQAADWYFERAEFSSASRTWQLLMSHPRCREMQAELLFRAALAEKLSGNEGAAKVLRNRLEKEFPAATGVVDGSSTDLLAAVDKMFKEPAWDRAVLPQDEWPSFQGNAARSGVLNVTSSAGARLWGVNLADPSVVGEKKASGSNTGGALGGPAMGQVVILGGGGFRRVGGQSAMDPNNPALSSHPVISSGTLYVHSGEKILALSANAGTLLWSYPQQPISRFDPNQAQMYSNMGLAYRPVSHDSAAVFGDQIFAVLPSDAPQPRSTQPVYYGAGAPVNTRVVALNRNGVQLWDRAASTVKTDGKGQLSFMGSPLVTRQGVFVMGRKQGDGAFSQVYLIRLDRESGEVTWSCYLCSASTGGYYGVNLSLNNIAVPSLVDDVVYISTGQGADCAVDANAGRIMWLQITESAKKQRSPAEMFQPNLEFNPSWKFNPPQVYGDKLITQETGGNVRVYDRWNGRLIRSISQKELGIKDSGKVADVMAGILDGKLILVGASIMALDLDTIEKSVTPVWNFTPETPLRVQGRPFLASTILYVPYDKGLMMLDPKSGKQMNFSDWPRTDNETPGKPGNILVTSEQIVVVSDTEVAGYSKWETARDNRLARIKLNPTDPEPYLALAEIAFRTDHGDLAVENMKQAVNLANAPQSGASADLLSRLYRTNLNFAEQLFSKPVASVRDQSRFYYEQCKLAARDPEQQAEWRLCMSRLSLAQKNADEAAALFSDVLTDSALRTAPYRRGESLARAGVKAEDGFRELIKDYSPTVYKRYEDQALAMLGKARSSKDPAGLMQVVESYPNSTAALDAATELAVAYRDRSDFANQYKTLRWLYTRVSGDRKARVTADLVAPNLALKHYSAAVNWTQRGLRQYKDFSWKDPATGKTLTFELLSEQLRATGATVAEGRLPVLPPPTLDSNGRKGGPPLMDDESATTKNAMMGNLLSPIEQAPGLRRPDKLFVNRAGHIRIIDSATMSDLTAGKTVDLKDNLPTSMLGHSGDIAVLIQAKQAIGLNVKTQAIEWTIPFAISPNDLTQQVEMQQKLRQQALQQAQMTGQNAAAMIYVENPDINASNVYYQSVIASLDADQAREFAFMQLNRAGMREVAFTTARILNNKLMVVVNGQLSAYDIATGLPAWKDRSGNPTSVKLPEGYASCLVGNEDFVAVQMDNIDRGTSLFCVVEADTGKFRRQIRFENERALWRTLSEDGSLFVVSDQSVSAYDLFNDQDKPLWRREDLRTRYPSATALTLDGLIVVSPTNDLVCVSQEGGELRWPLPNTPPVRLELPASQGQSPFLRAVVDGDLVIYQSNQGMVAYYSQARPAEDGQIAWKAADPTQGKTPPLASFQVSEPYAVVLAMGPVGSTQRAVSYIFINHKGGKRHLERTLPLMPTPPNSGSARTEGPFIQRWQLLDNGIAFEAGGQTYFYHGKMP